MAGRLIGAWNPAIDSLGKPYSGALLTTYAAGTTTLKATYTDASLTVPLTNPVGADAAGRFVEIWGADGAVYDLDLTTAGGAVVKNFPGIQTLGATATGAVTRDFGANGKLNLESRGGITYLEGGDADPDNVGGSVVIGGWAGTQADSVTINAASLGFTGLLSPQQGIQFPAVQAASSDPNNLDDFEEGVWTPTLVGDTGASGQAYSVQVGQYVKIGRKVTCFGSITLTTKGTLTGTFAAIKGLPYLPDNSSSHAVGGLLASAGITNHYSAATYHSFSNNFVYIAIKTSSSTTLNLALLADISNGAQIDFTFEYLTAF